MKISTDKRELNGLAHYLLHDKVKITRITAARGVEIEVDPGTLSPRLKFTLRPRKTADHSLVIKIGTRGAAASKWPSLLAQGFSLAATAFGPDAASAIAQFSDGILVRESRDRIRLDLDRIRQRYQLQFTPVISSLALGSDRLELEVKAA